MKSLAYLALLFTFANLAKACPGYCQSDATTTQQNRTKRSFHPHRSERYLSKQISRILDELFLSGYDRQIRPQIAGPPLEVEVNVAIRSMGPVDETKQTFALDCYFRQFWTDSRLKFNSTTSLEELAMNWAFLNRIWRPDTFILNGKDSYLHKITVPNRFIRISPKGRISYSQRLTLKARCQMDLHKFPFDTQICPLYIGSFGHASQDIIYKWSAMPLSMDKLELSQFDLVHWRSFSQWDTSVTSRNHRNKSLIALEFTFQRQKGFFLLQIYVPLTLIVCSSWVTFWLVKTDKGSEIPARTGLGGTTVLSVVTIGFGGKGKPQVGYPTALDVFIIICFVTVFAAMVEFAILNFADTLVRRIKKKDRERRTLAAFINKAQNNFFVQPDDITPLTRRKKSIIDDEAPLEDENLLTPEETPTKDCQWETIETMVFNGAEPNYIPKEPETIALSDIIEIKVTWSDRCWDCLEAIMTCCSCKKQPIRSREIYKNTAEVFDRVDGFARIFFPFTFMLLNSVYWTFYLYIF